MLQETCSSGRSGSKSLCRVARRISRLAERARALGFDLLLKCVSDYFGGVFRLSPGAVCDLSTAARTGSDDRYVGAGLPNGGEDIELSDRH